MGDSLTGAGAAGAGAQAVGGAAGLANGIEQGKAYRAQGNYANRIAQVNAQMSALQAADARKRGDLEAGKTITRGQQIVSAQRAGFGAGGTDVNSGTASAVQAGTQAVSQLDALTISHNAAMEAIGYNMQGINLTAQGKMAQLAGRTNAGASVAAGGMKFANSLLQDGNTYNQYRPRVPTTLDAAQQAEGNRIANTPYITPAQQPGTQADDF